MAYGYSTADLVKMALRLAGERNDGNSKYQEQALHSINTAYRDLLAGSNKWKVDLGEPWPWALETTPIIITLLPAYETGSITVTNGSTSATLSATATLSYADAWLKISDRATLYRISAHTAGTAAITLDANYIEDSGSGLTYKIFPTTYSLTPSRPILRLASTFRTYHSELNHDGLIRLIDKNRFNMDYPRKSMISGVPEKFCIISQDETSWKVEFNRYVKDDKVRADIDYISMKEELVDASTSIPVLPMHRRSTLALAAAWEISLQKEDFQTAGSHLSVLRSELEAMSAEAHKQRMNLNSDYGRLIPRPDLSTEPRPELL